MFTVSYSVANTPPIVPIPVLDIQVESTCKNPPPAKTLTAVVDTGCDFSVIPDFLVRNLKLVQKGIELLDFGAGPTKYPKFEVKINVQNTQPLPKCYIVAVPMKETILGRNIINYWKIKLDGTAIPIPTLTIY